MSSLKRPKDAGFRAAVADEQLLRTFGCHRRSTRRAPPPRFASPSIVVATVQTPHTDAAALNAPCRQRPAATEQAQARVKRASSESLPANAQSTRVPALPSLKRPKDAGFRAATADEQLLRTFGRRRRSACRVQESDLKRHMPCLLTYERFSDFGRWTAAR